MWIANYNHICFSWFFVLSINLDASFSRSANSESLHGCHLALVPIFYLLEISLVAVPLGSQIMLYETFSETYFLKEGLGCLDSYSASSL